MKALILFALLPLPPAWADPPSLRAPLKESRQLPSKRLGGTLRSSTGVASHLQSESSVLPYLEYRRRLFADARVLDIGTGNGVIALYAARLGAKTVVATDINPQAIADTKYNAFTLKLADRIDARTVSPQTPGAYTVLRPGEQFDIIVANPPYTVDLESTDANFTDANLLGPSIVDGLAAALAPNGVAILLYRNVFYHSYLVRLARARGYAVRSYPTDRIPPRELEILFNSYAQRIDAKLGLKDGQRFDAEKDEFGQLRFNVAQRTGERTPYPGIIVISRKKARLDQANDAKPLEL